MSGQVHIELGRRTYVVEPQPHPVVTRSLPALLSQIGQTDSEMFSGADQFRQSIGNSVYEVLKLFLPDLMPRHEFEGYGTEGSFKEGGEPDEIEAAPSITQIADAFDKIWTVNGLNRIKDAAGNVLGPELRGAIRQFVVAKLREEVSKSSESLPPPSGESGPTSSGETPQTSDIGGSPESSETGASTSPQPVTA